MLSEQAKNKDFVKLCQVQSISSLSPFPLMFPNSENCEQKKIFPEIKIDNKLRRRVSSK